MRHSQMSQIPGNIREPLKHYEHDDNILRMFVERKKEEGGGEISL